MKCADCGVGIGVSTSNEEFELSVGVTIWGDSTTVDLSRSLCEKCYKKWHKRIQSFVTEFLKLGSEK